MVSSARELFRRGDPNETFGQEKPAISGGLFLNCKKIPPGFEKAPDDNGRRGRWGSLERSAAARIGRENILQHLVLNRRCGGQRDMTIIGFSHVDILKRAVELTAAFHRQSDPA